MVGHVCAYVHTILWQGFFYILSQHHRIIDDKLEKYDAHLVVFSKWDCRNEEFCSSRVKGEGGRAFPALAHPPTTPIPHAQPGVGYICGLWVLPGRYNSQSKRANSDCAEFVFPLYSFLFWHP